MEYTRLLDLLVEKAGSQKAVAERLGVAAAVVSGWRHRGVPPDRWNQILKEFDLTEVDLVCALSAQEVGLGLSQERLDLPWGVPVELVRLAFRIQTELPESEQAKVLEAARAIVARRDRPRK